MLQGVVLNIEICHKDKFRSDEVIATTSVHLEEVLDAPLSDDSGCRCLSMDLPLVASPNNQSVTGPTRQCGRIQAVIYLEDLGGEKAPRVQPYATAMDNITDLSMIEPFETSRHQQQQHHSTLSTDSTGNLRPEYICAVELETWKKNEEAKFRVWLKDQEAARMKTLNAEYTAKEATRQREFADKMKSLATLEAKLKKKATELEQRETDAANLGCHQVRILAAEEGVAKEKEGVATTLRRRDEEHAFAQKRLVTDHEHALRLQAEKTKIASKRAFEAEERVKELQLKVKEAEESANKAHATLQSSNMVQLQADVKVLKHQLEQAAHRELLLAKSRDHFRAAVRQLCKQLDKQNIEVSLLVSNQCRQ
ncbi:axoneme-associated protein mst101, putative [Perkinsus marinus ATCC 50983]|uniref:Axoneme-associated protein mst101, putative n=1 Tax=Perkinsus marinus (strain ATCC 50983 / TXsc) TaxID=423536 RepID=C5KXL3_PERM5|nr:axoneme-associated protein mst101, putative [Perkinsus marinus ATCC 50983]EER10737.1 axoneme-associated protein mst101, putative [Perkinsus marinus ATCC 50983]|eukprot:XP_002778942.1 axoneme-associated protein mst101, putative [Perkinsus marinus ATCC 50983]